MPIKSPRFLHRWTPLAAYIAGAVLALPALAQTDDAAPFYVGGSLGVSHVSNIYREASSTNSDTVVSAGVLGGLDRRWGRQHFKLDGSLQDNRYSTNRDLNNQSYSLRTALDWQTVGDLSGTLSAKSDRSLADFNIGNGTDPIFKKNTEHDDQYQAIAKLGVATRYTLQAGWTHRRRDFSAEEYDRLVFSQDEGSLGIYATPAGNLKLGLVGRHTKGKNPNYPVGIAVDPATLKFVTIGAPNDYTRDDIDFTTRWSTGGSSVLNTRISRSKRKNSLPIIQDFSGTTGLVGWDWQATGKLMLNLQYSRDTGQESLVTAADVNRIYASWQAGGTYALTGKVSLNASISGNRASRTSQPGVTVFDAFENNKHYNVGMNWTIWRGFSLGCQYDHASRDSTVALYVYTASSYGCTGQAILY